MSGGGTKTRDRILDAAEELFAEFGFDATKLRDVALEVGIQPPSLYNHFATKEALYDAVLDRAFAPIFEEISELSKDTESLAKADVAFRASMDLTRRHPRVAKLLYQELLARDPMRRSGRDWLIRLIQTSIALPGRRETLDEYVRFLMGFNVVLGFFALERTLATELDLRQLPQDQVLDRYLRLLSNVSASFNED